MKQTTIALPVSVSRQIGECIYCGLIDGELATEHAIPDAIFGNIELLHACCKLCERKINVFEQNTLRKTWGVARHRLGIIGRRKKKRPPEMPKLIDENGLTYRTNYHFGHSILIMLQPNSLPNLEIDAERNDWHGETICFNFISVGKANPENHQHETGTFMLLDFYRTICKISLGLAIYQYGHDSFNSIVNNFILNAKDDLDGVGDFLGASEALSESSCLHEWETYEIANKDGVYIGVKFRPFSFMSKIIYHVVVGKIREQTNLTYS